MKVYLVGDNGPEHNNVVSIHHKIEGALKAWNEHRLTLLKEMQYSRDQYCDEELNTRMLEMYERIIENLQVEDPRKIDCYPHATPYIQEMELLD
jgi:hypothetical protein